MNIRFAWGIVLLLMLSNASCPASDTNIIAFESDGRIVWQNVDTSLYYRIEWAAKLPSSNGWWTGYIQQLDIHTNSATVTSPVPRFFRVVGGSQMLVPDVTNVRVGTIVQGVSGSFWEGERFRYGPDTNTVIDNKTGLMWTRNLSGWGWSNWTEAVECCANLEYAGYSDWRLPTVDELAALMPFPPRDLYDNKPALFVGLIADYYWSSTENGPSLAYRVRVGSTHADDKTADNYIWPVRDYSP